MDLGPGAESESESESGDWPVGLHENAVIRPSVTAREEKSAITREGEEGEANRCLRSVVLIRGSGKLRGMTVSRLSGRRGGEGGRMRSSVRGIWILCVLHVDLLAGWSEGEEWLFVCLLFVRNAAFRIPFVRFNLSDHEKEEKRDVL